LSIRGDEAARGVPIASVPGVTVVDCVTRAPVAHGPSCGSIDTDAYLNRAA
jgi:hypothetical protein